MTRRVGFLGGPQDGDERTFAGPLLLSREVLGQPFVWKKDGVVTGRGQKVYRYCLVVANGKYVYDFDGETIQTLEGGEPDVDEEARGGGDSPGPEPEPEPDGESVGGVE